MFFCCRQRAFRGRWLDPHSSAALKRRVNAPFRRSSWALEPTAGSGWGVSPRVGPGSQVLCEAGSMFWSTTKLKVEIVGGVGGQPSEIEAMYRKTSPPQAQIHRPSSRSSPRGSSSVIKTYAEGGGRTQHLPPSGRLFFWFRDERGRRLWTMKFCACAVCFFSGPKNKKRPRAFSHTLALPAENPVE